MTFTRRRWDAWCLFGTVLVGAVPLIFFGLGDPRATRSLVAPLTMLPLWLMRFRIPRQGYEDLPIGSLPPARRVLIGYCVGMLLLMIPLSLLIGATRPPWWTVALPGAGVLAGAFVLAFRADRERSTWNSRPGFSVRAQQVLRFAEEEGGPDPRAAHLLSGLLLEGKGAGGLMLLGQGLTLDQVRSGIAETEGSVPLKAGLEAGAAVARRLGHAEIGTEHLLLGLLEMDAKEIRRLLGRRGLDPEALRRDLLDLIA